MSSKNLATLSFGTFLLLLAATGVAAFFGTSFLLVTNPWEEMPATRSKAPAAMAVIPPAQIDTAPAAATETSPAPTETAAAVVTETSPAPTDTATAMATETSPAPSNTAATAATASSPAPTDTAAAGIASYSALSAAALSARLSAAKIAKGATRHAQSARNDAALVTAAPDASSSAKAAQEATLAAPAIESPQEAASSPPAAPASAARPAGPPSAAEVAEFLTRGDSFVHVGDIASARVFYQRAADAGDARGALRLGATFDPAFLRRAGLDSTFADPAEARSQYRRTLDLGGVGAIQTQSTGTVAATCKDHTSFTGTKRSGACRGHNGVQSWSERAAASSPTKPSAAQPAPTTRRQAAPAPAGSGQVWVNTASKVYHCPGTRWYGTTQQGSYMSEAQAQAAGARHDHGTSCSS
jgi:hypothetical protein